MNEITGPELDGCIVESSTVFERPSTLKLYNYWLERCEMTPDIGPQHENIELTDIIECAPFIMYKDVVDSGYDFKNRYWGTEIAKAFSVEATGKTFRDYYEGKVLEQVLEVSNFVISQIHAIRISGRLKFVPGVKNRRFDAVYLPLFDDTGVPSRYIAAYDFF